MLKIFVPAVFFCVVFTHLFACLDKYSKEYEKTRKFTKGFLMPLLALSYFTLSDKPSYLLIIAIFLGFLGDILKLPLPGGIFFGIGHIIYGILILQTFTFSAIPIYIYIIPCILILIYFSLVYKKLKPHLKAPLDYFVVIAYMFLISFMGIATLFAFINSLVIGTISIANISLLCGGILFIASDTILALSMYIPDNKTKHFQIMSTYIFGQTFIILGMLLLEKI